MSVYTASLYTVQWSWILDIDAFGSFFIKPQYLYNLRTFWLSTKMKVIFFLFFPVTWFPASYTLCCMVYIAYRTAEPVLSCSALKQHKSAAVTAQISCSDCMLSAAIMLRMSLCKSVVTAMYAEPRTLQFCDVCWNKWCIINYSIYTVYDFELKSVYVLIFWCKWDVTLLRIVRIYSSTFFMI